MATFQTVHELAGVATAIGPLVLAEAFGFSLFVLTYVAVAVGKEIRAIAFSEAGVPFTFVLVAVCEDMHAIALSLRLDPLADVAFSVATLPDAVAVLDALHPLAIVDFAVLPLVDALPIRFAIFVRAVVRISIRKDLVSAATSLVVGPFSLVGASVVIDEHAKAFSLPLFVQLAAIDAIFVLLDSEILSFPDSLVIELIRDHFIPLDRVTLIFELAILLTRWSEPLLDHLISDELRHFSLCHSCLHSGLRELEGLLREINNVQLRLWLFRFLVLVILDFVRSVLGFP